MKAEQERSMDYYRLARYLLLLALFFSIFSMKSTPGLAAEEKTNSADGQLRGRAYALFFAGNTYYDEGNYQAARESYEKLIEQGLESGNLYYNLGNTYYKLGKKGMAVLYYEKARRFMPQDADLKANLSFVTEQVEEGEVQGWTRYCLFLSSLCSLEKLFIYTAVTFCLFMLAVAVKTLLAAGSARGKTDDWRYLLLRTSRPVSLGLLVLLVFLSSLTILTYYHHHHQKLGVAIQADGEVRYAPDEEGTLYFHLSEGARLLILEERDEWRLIKTLDGKRGWVKKEYIAVL